MSQYYGHGIFNPTEIFKGYDGKKRRELIAWMSMLDRCYGTKKNGMVMSERWLSYRDFAHDYAIAYHDLLGDHSFSAIAALDLEAVSHSVVGHVYNTNFGQPQKEYSENTTFFLTPRVVRLLRTPDNSRGLTGVKKHRSQFAAYGRKKNATYAKALSLHSTAGAAHAAWRRHQLELMEEAVREMEWRAVQLRAATADLTRTIDQCVFYSDFVGCNAFNVYMLGIKQVRLWMSAFKTGIVAPVSDRDRDDFESNMYPFLNDLDCAMLATYYSVYPSKCTEIGKLCRDKEKAQTVSTSAVSMEQYYDDKVKVPVLVDNDLKTQLEVKRALDKMLSEPKPKTSGPKPAPKAQEPDPFYAHATPEPKPMDESDLVGNEGFEKVPAAVWDMWVDADPWLRADMGYDERLHGKLPEKAPAPEPESEAAYMRRIQAEFAALDAEGQQEYLAKWVRENEPKFVDGMSDYEYDIKLENYGDYRDRVFPAKLYKF